MRPAQKKLVYLSLTALLTVILIAGLIAGWIDRNKAICPDNRPPVAQYDTGLGQELFRCANGTTVTNNNN